MNKTDDMINQWTAGRFIRNADSKDENISDGTSADNDIKKLETVLYLEALGRACLNSLAISHEKSSVKEICEALSEESLLVQNQIRLFLKNKEISQLRIVQRSQEYNIDPSSLPSRSLVDMALRSALKRLDIYKELNGMSMDDSRVLYKNAITRTLKEIKFLKSEQEFHARKEKTPGWNWLLNFTV